MNKKLVTLLVFAVFIIFFYLFFIFIEAHIDFEDPNYVSSVGEYKEECVTKDGSFIECTEGSVCFRKGSKEACPRGEDCSAINFTVAGDNICYKECKLDTDCPTGYRCFQEDVFYGDVLERYSLCMEK